MTEEERLQFKLSQDFIREKEINPYPEEMQQTWDNVHSNAIDEIIRESKKALYSIMSYKPVYGHLRYTEENDIGWVDWESVDKIVNAAASEVILAKTTYNPYDFLNTSDAVSADMLQKIEENDWSLVKYLKSRPFNDWAEYYAALNVSVAEGDPDKGAVVSLAKTMLNENATAGDWASVIFDMAIEPIAKNGLNEILGTELDNIPGITLAKAAIDVVDKHTGFVDKMFSYGANDTIPGTQRGIPESFAPTDYHMQQEIELRVQQELIKKDNPAYPINKEAFETGKVFAELQEMMIQESVYNILNRNDNDNPFVGEIGYEGLYSRYDPIPFNSNDNPPTGGQNILDFRVPTNMTVNSNLDPNMMYTIEAPNEPLSNTEINYETNQEIAPNINLTINAASKEDDLTELAKRAADLIVQSTLEGLSSNYTSGG